MKVKIKWIIISLLLIAACTAGSIYIYQSAQEKAAPERAMEFLLAETDGAYWAEGIRSRAHIPVTHFEEEAAVIDALLCDPLVDSEITYRGTDEEGVYVLSADGTDFCRVRLVPSAASAGFGLHYWQPDSTEILDSWLQCQPRTVEVTGPTDMRVWLNGSYLSTEYAVKTENRDTLTYRVEGIYADYALDVRDGEHNLLTRAGGDGDIHIYTK